MTVPEEEYKIEDVSAFVITATSGECIGFCVQLDKDRWAAICTSHERYLVGVYEGHRLAYDAVCDAEKENMQ
jgi:hypothetical protein